MELSDGKNAIGLKWVYKTKYHADGSIQKAQDSTVGEGILTIAGYRFQKKNFHVARYEMGRAILALVAN